MTYVPALPFAPGVAVRRGRCTFRPLAHATRILLAAVALTGFLVPLAMGQGVPQITKVNPSSGAVGAMVTITGKNLGKSVVSGVYLSDEKSDYKAKVVNQGADAIVITVPRVKPGEYNVSFQEGASIYIQPTRFTVQN